MTESSIQSSMSQKIFQMGLSVKTISIYLLCCGLQDMQRNITKANLMAVWNDTEKALEDGLEELIRHRVLLQVLSGHGATNRYRITEADKWHCPA